MTLASTKAAWTVLVVQDDPYVATLHSRLVDASPGFRAVGTAAGG